MKAREGPGNQSSFATESNTKEDPHMQYENPFALVKASDYTDKQINSLWVELGSAAIIDSIIEPKSNESKFILGGKGTGKTHLLRYYSYPAVRLRSPKESGLTIVKRNRFLAVFLRATSLDSSRFESSNEPPYKWQQLFGIYLELRLAEGVLDALCNIKETSTDDVFDDTAFIDEIKQSIFDDKLNDCSTISDFREWTINERRKIDTAIINAAFTNTLELKASFAIGSLCLPISRAIRRWNSALSNVPLIYLIDEIENFSTLQQQVVNSLIRYGEGLASFRVTGRRYAIKTQSTLADGEENREGSEYKKTYLDDILRDHTKSDEFSKKFIIKRLQSAGLALLPNNEAMNAFDPEYCFEEIKTGDYYKNAFEQTRITPNIENLANTAIGSIASAYPNESPELIASIIESLTSELPAILQKLNILLLFKKAKKKTNLKELASQIKTDALHFLNANTKPKNYYSTAYGHYSSDLFAQLCRESKSNQSVPYAGYDTFVKMASGNPRSLLTILGKAYEIATFKGVNFISEQKLSIAMQTEAAQEAARFMYESDTNFGKDSDIAREATTKLATLLRAARYSLNIPEVSPLAFSFADEDLTPDAKKVLHDAINYSLVFELLDGRPDRNSQRLHRKIQLNPLISPKWGLPISVRGDISLNRETLKAIFNPDSSKDFTAVLNALTSKWNSIAKNGDLGTQQELF